MKNIATKQLNEQFNKYSCTPSTRAIATSIYRSCPGYNTSFVVDFHVHNKKVCRYRSKGIYKPATLSLIREQFLNCPFVNVKQKYSAYVYAIELLPFDRIKDREYLDSKPLNIDDKKTKNTTTKIKNDTKTENRSASDSDSDTEDRSRLAGSIQQQHIIATASLLTKAGFKFAKEVVYRIAGYSARAIALAIEYVKIKQTGRRPVANPEGYLIDCLERGYWKTLEDRESCKDYWQQVVDNFRNAAVVLSDKFKRLPEVTQFDFDGHWQGAGDRLSQLISLLDENYYSEELISSAIATAQQGYKRANPSTRRRAKGFGKK